MESLKKLRTPLRSSFTKMANILEQYLANKDFDLEEIEVLINQLNEKWLALDKKELEIHDILVGDSECSQEIFDSEYNAYEMYKDKYIRIKTKVDKILSGTDDRSTASSETATKRRFKLPKVEFKKFNGEIKEWLGFWGQFRKIHEDTEIPPEDKFIYLSQSTVEGSRAREIVDSFPPSAENYVEAVECLKSRFGREDLLIEVYVRELLGLVLSNSMDHKKTRLASLYDKIESHIRALNSLGVTSDKYASILYPLVESCLPEDILRVWERSTIEKIDSTKGETNKLTLLMNFLKSEVEGEQRIAIAKESFGFDTRRKTKYFSPREENVPTAFGLFGASQSNQQGCAFCGNSHDSHLCRYSLKMNLDERKKMLMKKGFCFTCLKVGHRARECKCKITCERCKGRHFSIMCNEDKQKKRDKPKATAIENDDKTTNDTALSNRTCRKEIILQTLYVKLRGKDEEKIIRCLIDSGSQQSYLSKRMAEEMGYDSLREEKVMHNLFGGRQTTERHFRHRVLLGSINDEYRCNFEVLDQKKICTEIPVLELGLCTQELKERNITLTDQLIGKEKKSLDVDLLIGADVAGKLLNGKIVPLPCGLVAVGTHLGWTLMGKMPVDNYDQNSTMVITNLLLRDIAITELWKLETIGISDPVESKRKIEIHQETLTYFQSTLKINDEGRYEVALPWVLESSRLPDNRQMAERRLHSVYKKLMESNKVEAYTDVFNKWIDEDIIEEVEEKESNVHYLPHRPVFKENSATTKVRPVFDASAHTKGIPSLNACLETGPNMVELVPSLLTRFRKFHVGVTSDIEKAFLQIGIRDKDKDYLRFLWTNQNKEIKIYRHRRVVFGINCSPFLLAATLDYHLEKAPEVLSNTARILRNSFYVDNCACSLKNIEQANKFVLESQMLMSSGKFNLRGWYSNAPLELLKGSERKSIPLLGLNWNLEEDTLYCNINYPKEEELVLTKRVLLSLAQSIFDPLGISSPVTIIPKFMLQESWNLGLKWDDVLPEDLSKKFLNWLKKIKYLSEVKMPRWLKLGQSEEEAVSLHVFCDASAKAYATCIFLRVKVHHKITVRLVQSRARVSPLKSITIPRLELLACCIGSRLGASVVEDLKLENLKIFYWTDSTTALSWIRRDSPWGTFVWNRVHEIHTLTEVEQWRHVPGKLNPADLPTRGCSPEQFLHLKWWEGPSWLCEAEEDWPRSTEIADEDVVNAEKKKTVLSAQNHTDNVKYWYCGSSHLKSVRMLAWIRRFCNNCRKIHICVSPTLSVVEIKEAENLLLFLVQREVFSGSKDPRLSSLNVVTDKSGILRVKTRTVYRQDTEDFKYPVILTGDHPAVVNLILHKHRNLMHCGNQILLARLREKYWILKGRKSIRKTLNNCVRCKRFNAKSVKMNLPPLPEDRVREASVFEVTGVDLAGPLFLKDGSKAWIAIFTCAVYRSIHLELLSSVSTENFLLALRRFIARRGQPSIIYSDNGTNFVGASRLLPSIDWNQVDEDGKKKDIIWKFIPPSAPWWGGWWERLIALVKDLLRKVLGRACLKYEEMNTVLCDCEEIVNSRPITYLSEEDDLTPLTPSMFLREHKGVGIPDLKNLELSSKSLHKRHLYRCKLQEDIRNRFRLEYLGQLREQTKRSRKTREFKVGEIVLVEMPNQKRLNWPLGRIIEIFPSKEGIVYLTKVKTKKGEFLRPVQRLYALEVQTPFEETKLQKEARTLTATPEIRETSEPTSSPELNTKKTRIGREIRAPKRMNL